MLEILKVFYSLLLTEVLFNGINAENLPDADAPDCKVFFTYGYGYSKIFRFPESSYKGNELFMRFLVRARSDAHILLSTRGSLEDTTPVYEIVLGAGKNTFSDIRRSRRAGTKSSALTPDLLSATELRGFWIRITIDGLIEVGKENDDVPFVFWQDPDPLPIRYFGFSTWTEVFGKWFYDCTLFEKNGKIVYKNDSSSEVQKPMTSIDRLRNDLLKNYDPQIIPKMNFSEKLTIKINLQCHHIKLNSKKAQIIVDGLFKLRWYDEKLKWVPSDYGNVESIQLIHGEIWRPELVLYNAIDQGTEILGISGVIVNYLGEILWTPRTKLQAHCKLDLSSWPWDQHTCKLKLGFWALKDFLKLEMMTDDNEFTNHSSSSEWKLLSVTMEKTWLNTPWFNYNNENDNDDATKTGGDTTYSPLPTDTAMVIEISVKRVSSIYNYILLAPLLVIAVLSVSSFGFSPVTIEKIGLQCICLTLGSMFLLILDNLLPASAEHIPYLFKAYSESLIMVTISTIVSVCALAIIRQPHFNPPHRWIIYALNSSPLKIMLCLPEPNFDGLQKYDQLSEAEEISLDKNTSLHYWTVYAIAMDRITLFVTIIFIIHILFIN